MTGFVEIDKRSARRTTWYSVINFGLMLILAISVNQGNLSAQVPRKVITFDINGLMLNMNLDQVIKLYNINNIKVNKDVYGIINGYEIKKRINKQKLMVLLSFTGEKRLYRIHFSKLFEKYRYNSKDLYRLLTRKYGKAWTESADSSGSKNRELYACWGSSCKKYPRTTPILTARIYHSSGKMELMLADNRIFNKDWKLYKQKLSGQITDRRNATAIKEGNHDAF